MDLKSDDLYKARFLKVLCWTASQECNYFPNDGLFSCEVTRFTRDCMLAPTYTNTPVLRRPYDPCARIGRFGP
jgi:hypothetical protein